jgi:hypothetical protein
MDVRSELIVQFKQQEFAMTELMVRNEAVLFNFNSIQESVQKLQKKELDAVV